MRVFLLAALAATAFLAGCSDNGSSDDSGTPVDPGMGNNTTMEPLHWGRSIVAGADPFNFLPDPSNPTGANLPPCSQSASTCYKYDFTVNGTGNSTVAMVATLKWGLAANDLDLYLYQGNTLVSNDGINSIGVPPAVGAPATTQVMDVPALAAGEYTFWVVVWNAVNDAFTLDAVFA